MQDASLQESMGPIQDRTRENLVSTDNGIILARRWLLRAAKANREGKPLPRLDPKAQRVRSCSIELPKDVKFKDGAKARHLRAAQHRSGLGLGKRIMTRP